MNSQCRIEPVPAGEYLRASGFIVAGARCNGQVQARAHYFDEMARSAGEKVLFRRAMRHGRMSAAAMILDTPGRVGMLFYSSLSAPGVNRRDLVALLADIVSGAIGRGMAFVQATTSPSARKGPRLLKDAGMAHLADFIDMRCDFDLSIPPPHAEPPPWRWRDYSHFTETQLAEVILATYEQSLDCPMLKGLRSGAEIVAGHRATGVFCPSTWWLVETPEGNSAGCLLMNDVTNEAAANIVYLGVVPACRGRRLATAMLQHAKSVARKRGKLALTLSVDTRNTYALNAYLSSGFVHVSRRVIHVACAKAERLA